MRFAMSGSENQLPVERFREILFLPFCVNAELLHEKGCNHIPDVLTKAWGGWTRLEDWYCRDESTPNAVLPPEESVLNARFSEFVYFQPYVQRLLYQGKDSPVAVFGRKDVVGVLVDMEPSNTSNDTGSPTQSNSRLKLAVEQLQVLWFPLSEAQYVVVLLMEVALPQNENWPLSTIQDFLDRFRRLYPPYWDSSSHKPGRFPPRITWLLADGTTTVHDCGRQDFVELRQWTENHSRPPLAKHWRQILFPNSPDNPPHNIGLNQIEDERMPTMAYLAFGNPRSLTRSDFIRLCFADDSGSSKTYPYAPKFLNDFETRYCYDRYWDEYGLRPGTADNTTRYMNCGYAFTVLGQTSSGYFTSRNDGILSHFRRHYMVMGLLIHFQRAALLSFSDQMSAALTQHGHGGEAFRKAARSTLRQILDFTDRYWFPEISTQVQAKELYALWREQLNLQELYNQVMEEAREVTRFLDLEAENKAEEMARKQADAAQNLNLEISKAGLSIGRAGILMALASALATGAFGLLTDQTKPNFDGSFNSCVLFNAAFNVLAGLAIAFVVVFIAKYTAAPVQRWLGLGDTKKDNGAIAPCPAVPKPGTGPMP
jgi:hypothetical protein